MTPRPLPALDMREPDGARVRFDPAPDVAAWARATFINEGATVENPEHAHLQQAEIGFLWTNAINEKKGRMVLGQCQLMPPSGDRWTLARTTQQIEEWFGDMPAFLITLYAPEAARMDDASFMALVEHELTHAAQKVDRFGSPMFSKDTGEPIWTVRGHDIEEFVNVVARYGAEATGVAAMVSAANAGPTIAAADINIACGNCL